MRRAGQKSMTSSPPSIKLPAPDAIAEVARNLKLNKAASEWFSTALQAFAVEIIEAIENGDHDLTAFRRKRIVSLDRLKSALTDLSSSVANTDPSLFRAVLSYELGLLFSSAAFQQIVGYELGSDSTRGSSYTSRSAEFSRTGPYRHLEREVELERRKLAARIGNDVFVNTIAKMINRIDLQLKQERLKASGSPGNTSRRYILNRLIAMHNYLCEIDVSRTNNQYKELAEQVLAVLGQPTDGLEAAIRRILKQISRSRNPTRK